LADRYAGTGGTPVSRVLENRFKALQIGTIRVSGCSKIESRQPGSSREITSLSSPPKLK
jgi:hypothetical protein